MRSDIYTDCSVVRAKFIDIKFNCTRTLLTIDCYSSHIVKKPPWYLYGQNGIRSNGAIHICVYQYPFLLLINANFSNVDCRRQIHLYWKEYLLSFAYRIKRIYLVAAIVYLPVRRLCDSNRRYEREV